MATTNNSFDRVAEANRRRKFGKNDVGLLDDFSQRWFAKQSQDPWSAIGAALGYGWGSYLGNKEAARQMGKAKDEEDAKAREAAYNTAMQAAEDSGLVGMNSADAIMDQKNIYADAQNELATVKAKMEAMEDKNSDAYKGLQRDAYALENKMNTAHNTANFLLGMRTQNGLSNEGLYANNSGDGYMREKLGDISMLNAVGNQGRGGQNMFGATLPVPQLNPNFQSTAQANTNPTITEMAQNKLAEMQYDQPTGFITQDMLANAYLMNPDVKKKIDSEYNKKKRSAKYWKELRQDLRSKGLSEAVIDDYIDLQSQGVVDDMVSDYYEQIIDGNYLGADSLGTLMTNLDPQMAQVLKTGGVSIDKLFGADQNRQNALLQIAANDERARQNFANQLTRDEINRQNDLNDWVAKKIWELNHGGGGGGRGEKEVKLSSPTATQTANILGQAAKYLLKNYDPVAAWERVKMVKENYLNPYMDENGEMKDPRTQFKADELEDAWKLASAIEYLYRESTQDTISPEYMEALEKNAGNALDVMREAIENQR